MSCGWERQLLAAGFWSWEWVFVVPPARYQEPSTCSSFPAETFMSEVYLWFIARFCHQTLWHSSEPFGKVSWKTKREVKWMGKQSTLREWEYSSRSDPETSRMCVVSSLISVWQPRQIKSKPHFLESLGASQGGATTLASSVLSWLGKSQKSTKKSLWFPTVSSYQRYDAS